MPDATTIHLFYEANLPEYQRQDINKITAEFVRLLGWDATNPFRAIEGKSWKNFKRFVCIDWQGHEIYSRPPVTEKKKPQAREPEHGFCSCGGQWVKRQNREKKNYFLGCSRYPKCKNTQNI